MSSSHLEIFGVSADLTAEIGAIITGAVAITVGFAGFFQYLKSERWKRAEFAIRQIQALSQEPSLAFCCRAIDWGVGPLIIPEKYRVLFPDGATTIDHDWTLMAKALRPQLHKEWDRPYTKAKFLLYRYAFDDFLGYLDSLAMYENLGVIKPHDLAPLDDYLRQLVEPPYWENGTLELNRTQVFGDFIERFYKDRLFVMIHRRVSQRAPKQPLCALFNSKRAP